MVILQSKFSVKAKDIFRSVRKWLLTMEVRRVHVTDSRHGILRAAAKLFICSSFSKIVKMSTKVNY